MRLTYDSTANAAYLRLVSPIQNGEAVEQVVVDSDLAGDVIIDLDNFGQILGIELLNARALLRAETLQEAEGSGEPAD